MNADGSDKKLLTNNLGHNFYPSWSADGKTIIFTRMTGEKQELYSMLANGSDLKPVGVDTFYARQSPDGKKLAYIGGNLPKMSLWIASADGSNAKDIMN